MITPSLLPEKRNPLLHLFVTTLCRKVGSLTVHQILGSYEWNLQIVLLVYSITYVSS